MPEQLPESTARLQRVLAYAAAGLTILSLVCFAVLIIGTWLGAGRDQGSGKGIWPTVELLPLFALPIAMVMVIALLIVSIVARSRQNRSER